MLQKKQASQTKMQSKWKYFQILFTHEKWVNFCFHFVGLSTAFLQIIFFFKMPINSCYLSSIRKSAAAILARAWRVRKLITVKRRWQTTLLLPRTWVGGSPPRLRERKNDKDDAELFKSASMGRKQFRGWNWTFHSSPVQGCYPQWLTINQKCPIKKLHAKFQ